MSSSTAQPCPNSASRKPSGVVHLDGTIEVHLPPRTTNYLWLLDSLNLELWHPDVEPSADGGSWLIAPRHFHAVLRAVASEFGPFALNSSGPLPRDQSSEGSAAA